MYSTVPDEMIRLVVAPCLGYPTVGGIRASAYNAMPVEGCQSLANFMKDFASKKS
jgi:phosphoserine aminotransferase